MSFGRGLLLGSVVAFAFVPSGLLVFCMLVFATITAQSGYWLWVYSRAYTTCTPSGIATLGLVGKRDVPWGSVRAIGRSRYGSAIVSTAGGQHVRLGGPVLNMGFAGAIDPEFAVKMQQLQAYWHAVGGDAPAPA